MNRRSRQRVEWNWCGPDGEAVAARLEFSEVGGVRGLTVGAEQIVEDLSVRGILVDGGLDPWRPRAHRIEIDEVEAVGDCGGLEVRVRQNFDHSWQFRVMICNPGPRPVAVDGLILDAAAGPDAVLGVLSAGADTVLCWQRLTSAPWRRLELRTARGELVVTGDSLGTPPLRLGPGEAYTLNLRGNWYHVDSPLGMPQWVTHEMLDRRAGDELELSEPDLAIDWDRSDGPLRELRVAGPGGVTRLSVAYADEPAALARLVSAIRSRGILACASEGLAVQRASHCQVIAADEATALLAEYAERTPDSSSARQILLWLRMAATGGDRSLIERAETELAAMRVQPGYGMAWLNLWLQQSMLGWATSLAAPQAALERWLRQDEADPVVTVEMSHLLGPDQRRSPRFTRAAAVVERQHLQRPASAWPAHPDERLAHAVAVAGLAQRAPQSLVNRLLARAAATADPLDSAPTMGWLALVE